MITAILWIIGAIYIAYAGFWVIAVAAGYLYWLVEAVSKWRT